jgi:hypothetical protein
LNQRIADTYRGMEEELFARVPDVDDIEWPEPAEGDEDPDPLFDSTRDYVEQVDRFKSHQDKPTESERRKDARKARKGRAA